MKLRKQLQNSEATMQNSLMVVWSLKVFIWQMVFISKTALELNIYSVNLHLILDKKTEKFLLEPGKKLNLEFKPTENCQLR